MRAALGLLVALPLLAACPSKTRTPEPREPDDAWPDAAEDGVAFVRGARSLIAVANSGPAYFTVHFVGQKVQVPEGGDHIIVDGQIVQLVVVAGDKIPGPAAQPPSDEDLLRRHAAWETGFLAREVGKPLEPRLEPITTPSGRQALRWSVTLPPVEGGDPEETVTGNVFVTTVVAGHVVALGSPIFAGDDAAAVTRRLEATVASLETSDARIDPAKVK